MKYPYLIFSPKELIKNTIYKNKSAGVRALEKLCKVLNERGYEAYMTDGRLTPEGTGTVERTVELLQRGAIVVYHENIPVNAMKSLRPVAYILGEWGRDSVNQFCTVRFYYAQHHIDNELYYKNK